MICITRNIAAISIKTSISDRNLPICIIYNAVISVRHSFVVKVKFILYFKHPLIKFLYIIHILYCLVTLLLSISIRFYYAHTVLHVNIGGQVVTRIFLLDLFH
jgi:hypothetical protein